MGILEDCLPRLGIVSSLKSGGGEGVERVTLRVGEAKTVTLQASVAAFAVASDDGLLSVHQGDFQVQIGDTYAPATKQVRLRGRAQIVDDYRDYFSGTSTSKTDDAN